MGIVTKIKDKYELTKSVKITDVKGYLQKEYDRAFEREKTIRDYENQIRELKQVEVKYDALLVIQENTQKRIEKQDERIKELKAIIKEHEDDVRLAKSRIVDIKTNAEKKLKEKDLEIKSLKKQINQRKKKEGK